MTEKVSEVKVEEKKPETEKKSEVKVEEKKPQTSVPFVVSGPEWEDISPKKDKGIMKRIIKKGETGKIPPLFSKVKCHYVGTLAKDGTKFDSSRDKQKDGKDGEPLSFELGMGTVIAAWDLSVATMELKEICQIRAHWDYAYGPSGNPPSIGEKEVLDFEVELVEYEVSERYKELVSKKFVMESHAKLVQDVKEGMNWKKYENEESILLNNNKVFVDMINKNVLATENVLKLKENKDKKEVLIKDLHGNANPNKFLKGKLNVKPLVKGANVHTILEDSEQGMVRITISSENLPKNTDNNTKFNMTQAFLSFANNLFQKDTSIIIMDPSFKYYDDQGFVVRVDSPFTSISFPSSHISNMSKMLKNIVKNNNQKKVESQNAFQELLQEENKKQKSDKKKKTDKKKN